MLNLIFGLLQVFAAPTQIIWHGHAAFEVVTPKGLHLWIDPWLTHPKNKKKDPLNGIQADYLLLTHGHSDHVGDSKAIAVKTGAKLVTGFELGENLVNLLGFPKNQVTFETLINPGGEIQLTSEVRVKMTPAVHSSGLLEPKTQTHVYGGTPGGFVIAIEKGPTLYHTGDTDFFSDMALIAEDAPDIALVNIGGHFGMSPKKAAQAVKTVSARFAIPHHFGTFSILSPNPKEFEKALSLLSPGIVSLNLEVGGKVLFDGKELLTDVEKP